MILRGGEVIKCNFISALYGMLRTNYTVNNIPEKTVSHG